MSVRGKMFIASVEITAGQANGGGGSVKLNVVARGAENASWAQATPSGQMTLSVNNPPAFAFFRDHIGEECFIDITLADPALNDPKQHPFVVFEREGHYVNGKCLHCGLDESTHG